VQSTVRAGPGKQEAMLGHEHICSVVDDLQSLLYSAVALEVLDLEQEAWTRLTDAKGVLDLTARAVGTWAKELQDIYHLLKSCGEAPKMMEGQQAGQQVHTNDALFKAAPKSG
ncbi:hypothetical protein HK097_011363, partial [Rhizophlyctis rosea]